MDILLPVLVETEHGFNRNTLEQLSGEGSSISDHEVADRLEVLLEGGDFLLRLFKVINLIFLITAFLFSRTGFHLLKLFLLLNLYPSESLLKGRLGIFTVDKSDRRLVMGSSFCSQVQEAVEEVLVVGGGRYSVIELGERTVPEDLERGADGLKDLVESLLTILNEERVDVHLDGLRGTMSVTIGGAFTELHFGLIMFLFGDFSSTCLDGRLLGGGHLTFSLRLDSISTPLGELIGLLIALVACQRRHLLLGVDR